VKTSCAYNSFASCRIYPDQLNSG